MMLRRNGLLSLLFILVLSGGGLGASLAAGNEPLLGLDLQGGVSVVLEPVEQTTDDALGQAIEIIRQRVDGLGVAEPEIARQGDAIVVQLPGVKDRDRALELVGQTAELRFRPVLQVLPAGITDLDIPEEGSGDDTSGGDTSDDDTSDADVPDSEVPADEAPDDAADADEEEGAYGLTEGSFAGGPRQTGEEDPVDSDGTEPDDEPAETDGTEPDDEPAESEPVDDGGLVDGLRQFELTPPEQDEADAVVVLGQFEDGEEVLRYQLGPTELTGDILVGADARLAGVGTWTVAVEVRGDRIDAFNQVASVCFNGGPSCPTRQLAIVLDGRVVSAPSINAASFAADQIQISGSFTEGEAKDLALVLRYGALPVELVAQQTRSVSATLGKDALDAGVTAGLVGLALVALYMLVYYRLLGLVAILSLSVSASLLWTVVAYLGESRGLALTLAGVTGIIVSIGVAVDSNVVFYEHLKETVSRGRTMRVAVDDSFRSAFSTIVKADVASLIGAGVLYWLTVGPVRGFAFYLGLSTILDLVASYLFMRPAALLLVRSRQLQDRPRLFGMPATAEEGATA